MVSRFGKYVSALILALSIASGVDAKGDRLPGMVADRQGAFQSWDYNISVFQDRVESLFRRGPPGQRKEIQARLGYARGRGAREFEALQGFLSAERQLVATPSRRTGKQEELRGKALEACVEAFESYSKGFDEALHRAQGMYPEPHYRRLLERWKKQPSSRLLRSTELALRKASRSFVALLGAMTEGRRQRVYDAVHALQLAESPLDFFRQAELDRAFASLQAAYVEKLEPGLGTPEYPEFPVGSPLQVELIRKGSKYARARRALEFPPGREVEVSSPLIHRVASEQVLQREAYRLEELHQLGEKFRSTLEGHDLDGLEDLWDAYVEHRGRWFLVP
jgi:hypothetical protein